MSKIFRPELRAEGTVYSAMPVYSGGLGVASGSCNVLSLVFTRSASGCFLAEPVNRDESGCWV
jgi:hypothetical protein